MQLHDLKTLPEFFRVAGKAKPFEARKDDRDFQVGDALRLREWMPYSGYTGDEKRFRISYILRGEQWGIMHGYCVLGLGTVEQSDNGNS